MKHTTILALLLAGCAATPPPEPEPPPAPTSRVMTISIAALPPGSLIYKNSEFLGTAPLDLTIRARPNGTWAYTAQIQAVVPHCTTSFQRITYRPGHRVPTRLLFRVPGHTHWYSATQARQPAPPKIQ